MAGIRGGNQPPAEAFTILNQPPAEVFVIRRMCKNAAAASGCPN